MVSDIRGFPRVFERVVGSLLAALVTMNLHFKLEYMSAIIMAQCF